MQELFNSYAKDGWSFVEQFPFITIGPWGTPETNGTILLFERKIDREFEQIVLDKLAELMRTVTKQKPESKISRIWKILTGREAKE